MGNMILAGILVFFGVTLAHEAYALRCGTVLVNESTPLYKVQQACGDSIEAEYQVHNDNADIKNVYIKEGSMTHELKFIDGKLKDIKSSRFGEF